MIIDESHPEDRRPPGASTSCVEPAPPERNSTQSTLTDEGQSDYSGELVSDLDFAKFSHSALVRIADEICLQMHLLNLSFVIAVGKRAGTDTELFTKICTNQLTGIAGSRGRTHPSCARLPGGVEGAIRTLELHPLFNPRCT